MPACLVGIHARGLVLRTVEIPAITAGQAVVGNRRRLSGWGSSRLSHTGLPSGPMLCPAPKHRGSLSRAQSWLFPLLPPSVLLVTPVGPHPVFAFLFRLCSACLFGLSASEFSFPFPPFPSIFPGPSPCSLSCPSPTTSFSLLPHSTSFPSSLYVPPLLHPPTLSHHKREKKKGGRINLPQEPKQKLILSVFRSAASSWWPVCPCGLQPARPPYPSAVCPARLPALPFLPTTRSSVPGCLVMVSDV